MFLFMPLLLRIFGISELIPNILCEFGHMLNDTEGSKVILPVCDLHLTGWPWSSSPWSGHLAWSALRTDPYTVPLQGQSEWLLGRDILSYHISGPWYRIYYWFFSKKQRVSKTSDFREDGQSHSRPSLCHLPSEW